MFLSHEKARILPAFIVWVFGILFFFSEYFLRVSPSVMLPELSINLGVTAAGLGMFSAMFYYPYILMQIPVGTLTDYFNAKKIMGLASLTTGVACILFAESTSMLPALLSRFIMGFCGAFAFVGTLRIASTYFSIRTFSILTGITQAMGMMGAAFGQGPLRYYIDNLAG